MAFDLKAVRERKLVQWTFGYLGACFLVLQLFDVAAQPFGWSGTVLVALIVAMIVGMAVVLVLAWYHGEKGRQRVSGPELLILGALLVLGGLGLRVVASGAGTGASANGAGNPVAGSLGSRAGVPTLAVLPFEDLGGDTDQAYLADGMTELLTSAVATIRGLRVTSRTSVMRYRDDPPPIPQIARELGADLLVEGSVLRVGNQVRITAQLIRGDADEHLWAHSYEGALEGAMSLMADVARTIAAQMEVVLTPADEARLATRAAPSAQAMEAVLRARQLLRELTPENADRAIQLLERTLDVAPDYASAWGMLAQAQLARTYWFGGGEEVAGVLPRAESAARRGLALDSTDIEVQLALGDIDLTHQRWTDAADRYERVVDRDQSRYDVAIGVVNLQTAMGRYDEAETRARELIRIAPLSTEPLMELLNVLAMEGGPTDEMFALYERALALDRADWTVRLLLPSVLAFAGRCDDPGESGLRQMGIQGALGEAEKLRPDCGSDAMCLFAVAHALALCGQRDRALEIDHQVEARARQEYVSPFDLSRFRLLFDDREGAIRALEEGVESRDPAFQWLANGGWHEPLWGEARFEAVVDRVGLPRNRPPEGARAWYSAGALAPPDTL